LHRSVSLRMIKKSILWPIRYTDTVKTRPFKFTVLQRESRGRGTEICTDALSNSEYNIITLSTIFYEYETYYVILKEKCRLALSQNNFLSILIGPERRGH
jgi:hypothetical protein